MTPTMKFKYMMVVMDEARVRVLNSIIGGGIEKGYDSNRPNDSCFASSSYLARRDTLRYKDRILLVQAMSILK